MLSIRIYTIFALVAHTLAAPVLIERQGAGVGQVSRLHCHSPDHTPLNLTTLASFSGMQRDLFGYRYLYWTSSQASWCMGSYERSSSSPRRGRWRCVPDARMSLNPC